MFQVDLVGRLTKIPPPAQRWLSQLSTKSYIEFEPSLEKRKLYQIGQNR